MKKIMLASVLFCIPVRCQAVKVELKNYEMNIQEKAIIVVEAFAFTCMLAVSSILILISMGTIFQLVEGLYKYVNNEEMLQVLINLDSLGEMLARGILTGGVLLGIVVACNWLMPEMEDRINWRQKTIKYE